jgi:L,D-transpeptidase catalytic domain
MRPYGTAARRMSDVDSLGRHGAHSGRVPRRHTLLAGLLAAALGGPGAGAAVARPNVDPQVGTQLLRVRARAQVRLHARPGGPVVARLGARTEFGTHTVLAVLSRSRRWAQVSATALGGRHAWVRVDRLVARRQTRWKLVADVSRQTLTALYEEHVLHVFRVGTGARRSPTPTGRFQVTDKLRGPKFGPAYGCCILALSTNQPQPPPGWQGSARMAVHGTNAPRTVGRAASAGCLHAREAALRWMMRHVPVGTPVVIAP